MLHIISMSWSLLLLGAFLWWATKKKNSPFVSVNHILILIVIIGLLVRVVPAFFSETGTNYDIESYYLVSEHVVNLEDVYTAEDTITRHPYLPLQMYWIGGARILSHFSNISFTSMVRLLPILADAAISILIFFFVKQKTDTNSGFYASMLYALNPISVYVSAYHGQFDAIPVLSILLSIYLLDKRTSLAGLSLGAGILNKSWPVLFFPIAWQKIKTLKQKVVFTLAMGIPPLLGVLVYQWIYKARALTVLKRAITYNHGIGSWGYTYILRLLVLAFDALKPTLNYYLYNLSRFSTVLIIGAIWYAYARNKKPLSGFLLILLTFYAFSHAFAIQYLVWILPFAILSGEKKWLKWYTLAAFLHMFILYNTVINHYTITNFLPVPLANLAITIPSSLPVWIVSILWFMSIIRQSEKRWSLNLKDFFGLNANHN